MKKAVKSSTIVESSLIQIVCGSKLVCSIERIREDDFTIEEVLKCKGEGIPIPGGIVLQEELTKNWQKKSWQVPSKPKGLYGEEFMKYAIAHRLEPLGIRVSVSELKKIKHWDGNYSESRVHNTLYEQFVLLETPLTEEEQETLFEIYPRGYGDTNTCGYSATYFPLGEYGGIFLHQHW